MQNFKLNLLVGLLLGSTAIWAQKKIIDPSVYNDWKRIGDVQISANGNYSTYTIKPHQGDGYLYLVNNKTGKKDSIARGLEPQFSGNNSYLAFKITPGFDTLRKVELKKIAKDKWPKDSLGIWILESDSVIKIPNLKEFKISKETDLMAYLSTKNEWPKNYLSTKELKKEKKATKKNGEFKTEGKLLSIWNPISKTNPRHFRHIQQFEVAKNGEFVVFVEQQKFKKDSVRLFTWENSKQQVWNANFRAVEFSGITVSSSNPPQIAGLYTKDTSENKRWTLWSFDPSNNQFAVLIDTSARFETNRVLSNSYKPRFKNNNNDLFFGVWDAPKKPIKDTLLESEKVKLDLWHWKDDRMQPQQLVELKRDQSKTNCYVFHIATKTFSLIASDSLDLRESNEPTQKHLLASCEDQFRYQTWHTPNPANYYRISLADGRVIPLRNNTYFDVSLSPNGEYFVFWNELTEAYYAMNVENQLETCLTSSLKINWKEDINGQPVMAGPQGIIGWSTGDKGVLIQADRDIVYYDFSTQKLTSITRGIRNSEADTNFNYRIYNLEKDSAHFSANSCVITQFNKQNRAMNVYRTSGSFTALKTVLISGSNHDYLGFKKAQKSDEILYQRQSNLDYPDLYVTRKSGEATQQISYTNPQQGEYNWSTVEHISWTSYEGIQLEGLVYKPEDFDTNKTYPMIAYFYELNSDEIHNHIAPRPTASIVLPTEYASAGYVIFIPDVRYKPGHPANGAYDCILSGTDAVLKKYPNIDSKRLGLQGQSWGGYQTAQLITMTTRFAAAMAGAPVSNMFSAYGGIRWGSGFSRQFQYEHTQSRIGKTIWEAPELYVENSPVFGLPKVQTPLLIMHNDQDGAVPWYQGVELFTGLRRLQKPVWLLNYNGDDHNLIKNANRMDLSIRMRQFFDYYLQNAPMPLWLKDGIPAIEKGKENRYELIDEK